MTNAEVGLRVHIKDGCQYFGGSDGVISEVRKRGQFFIGVTFEGVPGAGTLPWFYSPWEIQALVGVPGTEQADE